MKFMVLEFYFKKVYQVRLTLQYPQQTRLNIMSNVS